MPRRSRMYFAGLTYHIVQRGNNKQPCFLINSDYIRYLELWKKFSISNEVAVHAYCLMTNHIHFIVTPECSTGISNTMKLVGSQYAQYFNKTHSRTGTLWEGRHRSSLIDTVSYLLTCMNYVELNPVRAGMVCEPADYPWSSFTQNTSAKLGWLREHGEFSGLGSTRSRRIASYMQLFNYNQSESDIDLIRAAAHYCQPIGDDAFRREVEKKFGLRRGYMKRGKPPCKAT